MPPRVDKEIVLFVTNIGRQPVDGDANFFENAKEVMKLIIQKKILMRPKDEVQIILGGTTRKVPNDTYAKVLQPCQIPTWDFLQCVLDIEQTSESFEYWPRTFLKALEQTEQFPPKTHVIVILLFDCEATSLELDLLTSKNVIDDLADRNVDILWIGSKPLKDWSPRKHNESEKVLLDILDKTYGGEYMTVDRALESLRIFRKHQSRYMAWKCDLVIGGVAIPTSTYVQATEDDKRPSFQTVNTRVASDNTVRTVVVKAERDYVDRHREAHPVSATIPGYMYGRRFIPVSESDARGMNENSDVKSMIVFGFVTMESLALEDLAGNSSRVVLPDGPLARKPFYCLVRAMAKKGYAAIVRRVYQSKSNPKMNVLFARVDEPGEPWCLGLVELTYAEDRRVVQTRSLDSLTRGLTEEQLDVVEDLVNSMMLTDAEDDKDDLFDPGTVPSPSLQHLWNSLSYRALNPHAPLPPMEPALQKLLATPDRIKARAQPAVARLKALFPKREQPEATNDQRDSNQPLANVPSEIKKEEAKIEESIRVSVSQMDETNVDLDELFDADMDI